MSDDRVCIGMFRPLRDDIPRHSGNYVATPGHMGGNLYEWGHAEVTKYWQLGHWDKPIYATRDEIIEKMAKLELEKRETEGGNK